MSEPLKFFQGRIEAEIKKHPGAALEEARQVPRTRERFTIGDFIYAVLAIEDEATAKTFYEGAVEYYKRFATDEHFDPGSVARQNIGYCFGAGMTQERIDMWVRVCQACSPYFGQRLPSPEVAVQIGQALGQQMKRRSEKKDA